MDRHRKFRSRFFAAASLLVGAAGASHGSLTIDLRISAASGGSISANKRTFTPSAVGQTLTINVWAQVRGSDPSKSQCFHNASGSFLSFEDGLLVNSQPAGAILPAAFQAVTSSSGMVQDLDGDGDLDIGSNNSANAEHYFRARTERSLGPHSTFPSGEPIPGFTSSSIAGGTEYRIAQLKFIMGAGVRTLGTKITFAPLTQYVGAIWEEDCTETTTEGDEGVAYSYSGGHTFGGDSGTFDSGPPVVIAVPDPAGLGLFGTSILLARKRNRERKRVNRR